MDLALYQIADQYLKDIETLQAMDIDEQTFADTLESMSGDFELKAQNVTMFVQNLEASANAIKDAERKMAERRKAIENKVERIKEYLKVNMQKTGITKIECPYFVISLRNNPESVDVINMDLIPSEYFKIPDMPPPQLDKAELKKAIQAGAQVEGARLIRTQSIQIK